MPFQHAADLHTDCPASSAYVIPIRHPEHASTFATCLVRLPYCPAGHGSQLEDRPSLSEYRPVGQLTHALAPIAPKLEKYVPTGHGLQVRSVRWRNVPLGQALEQKHAVLYGSLVRSPAAHVLHSESPSLSANLCLPVQREHSVAPEGE